MNPIQLFHFVGLSLAFFASSAAQASICESGRRQSPIDIPAQVASQPRQPAMVANYQRAPLKLANDGHTLRVRFAKAGELVLGNEHYALQQFHFHTPGGDMLNGEAFPFAAHILNKSPSGQLLAIVVPFRIGAESPLLAQVLPHIPPKVNGDHVIDKVQVNADDLLPRKRSYYRYSGSLTDKPCTENVEWLVMKEPLTLSKAQLATWRSHFKDNMRGVNPLNGRQILESD
jgi:carbonic anhydrase